MRRDAKITAFVSHIWSWYSLHKRQLPWRDLWHLPETDRAYRILVSEVMLQQTQVDRVKIIFVAFLKTFPTIEDLAQASNREVLMVWRGMGYNSRAVRLRDAARYIVGKYNVEQSVTKNQKLKTKNTLRFPTEMHELQSIPGIGPYTAAAIRNFAFNLPTPCLDTNIRRVLHRAFVGKENEDGTWRKDDRYMLKLAGEVMNVALEKSEIRNLKSETKIKSQISDFKFQISDFRHDAANWHSALMDYGSLVEKGPSGKRKRTSEPGREVSGKFIPNRIFRGRIVETLRDSDQGFPLASIGGRICTDWNPRHHHRWLKAILQRLVHDQLITKRGARFVLKD